MTDKKKILDVQMPKEEQEKLFKDPKARAMLTSKKWRVTIKFEQKVRYLYGDDPEIMQDYAKHMGAKILKVEKT